MSYTYLDDITKYCSKHNIQIIFKPSHKVDSGDGLLCQGYFETENGQASLYVGVGNEDWKEVFIHEFHHAKQYIAGQYREEEPFIEYFQWLSGDHYMNSKTLKQHMRYIQKCELNCEKRSVQFIKKYEDQLDIDVDRYIQKANAYVFFYPLTLKYRAWTSPNKIPLTKNESILNLMPTEFIKNYNNPPKEFEDLVVKHCFKKGVKPYE